MVFLTKKMQEEKLIVSFSEGRRLIAQGVVKVNDKVVTDISEELEEGEEVKINVGTKKEFKGKA